MWAHRYLVLDDVHLWLKMTTVLLEFEQLGLSSLIVALDVDVHTLFVIWSQHLIRLLQYLICLLKQPIDLDWWRIWLVVHYALWLERWWDTVSWWVDFAYFCFCIRKTVLKRNIQPKSWIFTMMSSIRNTILFTFTKWSCIQCQRMVVMITILHLCVILHSKRLLVLIKCNIWCTFILLL